MRPAPRSFPLLLLLWAALSTATLAQRLELELAGELALPERPVKGVYVGPAGGTFVVTVAPDGRRELLVHDGASWRVTRVLDARDEVLRGSDGGLVVARDGRLSTFTWQLLGPARQVALGRLPTGAAVAAVVLSSPTLSRTDTRAGATVAPGVDGTAPALVAETDHGIFRCEGGACTRVAGPGFGLLGGRGARTLVHRGLEVYRLSDTTSVIARGDWRADDVRPVGVATAGAVVFQVQDELYAVTCEPGAARGRIRDVTPLPAGASALVVGERAVVLAPDERPRSVSLADPGRGVEVVPIVGSLRHAVDPIGGRAAGFSIGGRGMVLTRGGLAHVRAVPSETLPVTLAASLTGVIGVGSEALLVGGGEAVERYGFGERGEVERVGHWPTATHLMRSSVPTCLAADGAATFVGTSDGRVLRLGEDRGAEHVETLASVVGLGTAFTDLYPDRTGLWAVYAPSSRRHSGLVHVTADGAAIQLDTAGIAQPIACVRRAAGGALYAGAEGGARPLYYYYEAHRLWVPLDGAIVATANQPLPQIREIAPVSDDLIYLATSSGVLRWRRGHGYDALPLPRGLAGGDVLSVRATARGCWIAVRGRGVYYYAAGEVDAVGGADLAMADDLRTRGLLDAGGGRVFVRSGDRVLRFAPPLASRVPLAPGLLFTTQQHRRFNARPIPGRNFALREPDSLFVRYGLSGFAPASVTATFSADGAPLRPAREGAGYAVFAPLPRPSADLAVRVTSRGGAYASAPHHQAVTTQAYWWSTLFGMVIIAGGFTLLATAIGGAYSLRQRRLAKQLERLVAERTSELQLAERAARRASAAKSMFLANMSHEIRTPLNAVLGMTDLLLASELNGEQVTYAESVQRGGKALHAIVGDVLAFAEIDSGSVRRRDEVTDLRELVLRACEAPRERAVAKGLAFTHELDVPERLRTDGPKVSSILAHLLDNAVKFTESGYVALRVQYIATSRGARLEIVVTDSGIGVAPELRERIFEVFEQADNSNTRRYGGTGLGLAIVDTYVSCLGGEVVVEASKSGGAAFSVELPVAHAPEGATSQPTVVQDVTTDDASAKPAPTVAHAPDVPARQRPVSKSAPAPSASATPRPSAFFDLAAECPLRILVAEDNAMNKMLILTVLTKLGYKADWAENGRVAVDRFAAGDYDLILMDVHMPEMDGLEATREIRERHRERAVTIRALTANASEEGREDCLAAGMDDFMTKPLQVPRLVEVLRAVATEREQVPGADGEAAVAPTAETLGTVG